MSKPVPFSLSRVQASISADDWPNVLRQTADEAVLLRRPRLFKFRMEAAINLQDKVALKDLAESADKLADNHTLKLVILRDLAVAGQAALAAKALVNDTELHVQDRFIRIATQIADRLRDQMLKKDVRALIRTASKGGSAIKPTASDFAFAKRPDGPFKLGSVTLAASKATPRFHIGNLRREARLLQNKIAKAIKLSNDPKVYEFHNVYTNRIGQIWNKRGAIIEGQARAIPIFDKANVPTVPVAMSVLRPARGVFHWIVQQVPPLAWMKEPANAAEETPILISDDAPDYETSCLEALGLAGVTKPVGDAIFVERLLIPRVEYPDMLGWSHIDWGLKTLIDISLTEAAKAGVALPSKIYISRRDADRRSIDDEETLERALEERGFAVYRFADIPEWHKIALAYSAEVIAGPHGAGLSQLIMARPGTKVIEILPIKNGTYGLRFSYARLSMVKNLSYNAWLEPQRYLDDGWSVDKDPFLTFVDQVLAGPAS